MKIQRSLYNNSINNINFRAGKTKLYTDFDGTYFPFYEHDIMWGDKGSISGAEKIFSDFKNFMDAAKEKFSMIITTGRTRLGLLETIVLFNRLNINFNAPDKYIFEDGSEEIEGGEISNYKDIYSRPFFAEPKTEPHDKLTQPKREVEKIIKNNSGDLIITAGDGYNDVNMLNPLNYIDLLGVTADENAPAEEQLEREDVLSALRRLPLAVIITGADECMKPLLRIKEILDRKGIYKIFTAENPSEEFLSGIKQGMYAHSCNDALYRRSLGSRLSREISEA